MNRRTFAAALASLPFVGRIATSKDFRAQRSESRLERGADAGAARLIGPHLSMAGRLEVLSDWYADGVIDRETYQRLASSETAFLGFSRGRRDALAALYDPANWTHT